MTVAIQKKRGFVMSYDLFRADYSSRLSGVLPDPALLRSYASGAGSGAGRRSKITGFSTKLPELSMMQVI